MEISQEGNEEGVAVQHKSEKDFKDDPDNLFDMVHQDTLNTITIEDDKQFLLAQWQTGRIESMVSVDIVPARKEPQAQKRRNFKELYCQWSKRE